MGRLAAAADGGERERRLEEGERLGFGERPGAAQERAKREREVFGSKNMCSFDPGRAFFRFMFTYHG